MKTLTFTEAQKLINDYCDSIWPDGDYFAKVGKQIGALKVMLEFAIAGESGAVIEKMQEVIAENSVPA